jgi:hypothetical protein
MKEADRQEILLLDDARMAICQKITGEGKIPEAI